MSLQMQPIDVMLMLIVQTTLVATPVPVIPDTEVMVW